MQIDKWNKINQEIIDSSKCEEFNVLPMVNKFLKYDDVNYHITSYTCILEDIQDEELINNMTNIIETQTLLRSVLIKSEKKVKIRAFQSDKKLSIPIIEVETIENIEAIVDEYIKDLINQDIYGNLLYRFAFLKIQNKILFFFIANHIIFDGAFNFKHYLTSKEKIKTDKYEEVSRYVDDVYNKFDKNSISVINTKKFLETKNYVLSSKTQSLEFTIPFGEVLSKSTSLEEPLIEIIFNTLTKCLDADELPMCILDGARDFGNRKFIYNQLGDLHDEKHFVFNKSNFKESFKSLNALYKTNRFLSLTEMELINNKEGGMDDSILININYYSNLDSNYFDDLVNRVKKKNKTIKKHYIRFAIFYDIDKDLCYVSLKYNEDLNNEMENFEQIFRAEADKLCI